MILTIRPAREVAGGQGGVSEKIGDARNTSRGPAERGASRRTRSPSKSPGFGKKSP